MMGYHTYGDKHTAIEHVLRKTLYDERKCFCHPISPVHILLGYGTLSTPSNNQTSQRLPYAKIA